MLNRGKESSAEQEKGWLCARNCRKGNGKDLQSRGKDDTLFYESAERRRVMYRYLFFDLDGTLTDSKEGIVNSVRYALEKLNVYFNGKLS